MIGGPIAWPLDAQKAHTTIKLTNLLAKEKLTKDG